MNGAAAAITPVATARAAFVGRFPAGPVGEVTAVDDLPGFAAAFGGGIETEASLVVRQFYANGGADARIVGVEDPDAAGLTAGIEALAATDFDVLCVPDAAGLPADATGSVHRAALARCRETGAVLLIDPPPGVTDPGAASTWAAGLVTSTHAAAYFPRVRVADPGAPVGERVIGPSGSVAGVYARTDREHGVWKAPAGTDAGLLGVTALEVAVDDRGAAVLGPLGVNTLREFPGAGPVVWGARTRHGTAGTDPEYRYVPVRRFAIFLTKSIEAGLGWAVFEPNNEPLWAAVRGQVGSFLSGLFRAGAFPGATEDECWFVRCGAQTMTGADIAAGRLVVLVGFAPLQPAEFVLLRIEQESGRVRRTSGSHQPL